MWLLRNKMLGSTLHWLLTGQSWAILLFYFTYLYLFRQICGLDGLEKSYNLASFCCHGLFEEDRSLETWSWKETLSLQHWCYLVLWIDHKSTWLILLIGFIIWSRLVLAFLDWLIGVNLCLSQRHGYKADWLIPMTTFIAVLY